MKKIAFIIPWFGPFPTWMPYTLASIATNPTIDFIFFTDNEAPKNHPANCSFNKTTWEQYKQRVSTTLKINFTPDGAYKLCDLKPSYGLIHQKELSGYDFWGFCDIDVIFGDIRHFITDQLLTQHSLFSAYGRRIAGHFTIIKNNEEWCQLFKKCPDWKEAFEDNSKHHCFDEQSFSKLFIRYKSWPSPLRKLFCYFTTPYAKNALLKEMYSTPELRYNWIDNSRNFPTEWHWKQGKLTNNASSQEFLYLHFLKWKRDWKNKPQLLTTSDNLQDLSWKITSQGFVKA